MAKTFILALATAAALTTAASAQTTPPAQPDKQNACTDGGMHNNMLPAIRPGEKPKTCDSKTPNTPSSPASTPANQGDTTQPDQSKPGTQTRSQDNTTTMHTPGSENSQDQGPTGAPK